MGDYYYSCIFNNFLSNFLWEYQKYYIIFLCLGLYILFLLEEFFTSETSPDSTDFISNKIFKIVFKLHMIYYIMSIINYISDFVPCMFYVRKEILYGYYSFLQYLNLLVAKIYLDYFYTWPPPTYQNYLVTNNLTHKSQECAICPFRILKIG